MFWLTLMTFSLSLLASKCLMLPEAGHLEAELEVHQGWTRTLGRGSDSARTQASAWKQCPKKDIVRKGP